MKSYCITFKCSAGDPYVSEYGPWFHGLKRKVAFNKVRGKKALSSQLQNSRVVCCTNAGAWPTCQEGTFVRGPAVNGRRVLEPFSMSQPKRLHRLPAQKEM